MMLKSTIEHPELEGTHTDQSPTPGPARWQPQESHYVPDSIYPPYPYFYLLKSSVCSGSNFNLSPQRISCE